MVVLPHVRNNYRAPHRSHRKVDFRALTAVRRIGHNPFIGAWRVYAKLRQLAIKLSPRTVGRMLALNHQLYDLARQQRQPREKKVMPFRAAYHHQYWTVDLRYLDHGVGGGISTPSPLWRITRVPFSPVPFPVNRM